MQPLSRGTRLLDMAHEPATLRCMDSGNGPTANQGMDGSLLSSVRQMRYWMVRWLIAAMLLPLLLSVLPPLGASAAAALERDLAWSVCNSDGGMPADGGGQHQKHDTQCILCFTGCPLCAPALPASAAVAAVESRDIGDRAPRAQARSTLILHALRVGSPPRGPPAA